MLLCGAMGALAQDVPYSSAALTLSATTAAPNTTTTITTDALRVRGNQGMAFLPSFALTGGSGTNAVTLRFQVSHDGTTWSTVEPFTYTMNANGTNAVRGFVNFAPTATTSLNNVRYMRLGSVQVDNASANSVTNMTLRYSHFNR